MTQRFCKTPLALWWRRLPSPAVAFWYHGWVRTLSHPWQLSISDSIDNMIQCPRTLVLVSCVFLLPVSSKADEWVSLFDGKTTAGWKANEKPESFTIENGELKFKGGMAHLFCEKEGFADLKNFEFKAEVKTLPGANSGVFFHTENRGPGGLKKGYEAQINTSFVKDPRKTGSLVDVKDLDKSPTADNEWFEFHLVVSGKRIVVNINGKPVVDYTEEDKPIRKKGREERILSHGPIALQAHDPDSTTYFRNIQIKKLPD